MLLSNCWLLRRQEVRSTVVRRSQFELSLMKSADAEARPSSLDCANWFWLVIRPESTTGWLLNSIGLAVDDENTVVSFDNESDSAPEMFVRMKKLRTLRIRLASVPSLLKIKTRVPQSKNSTGWLTKECNQLTWYVKTAESSELQKLKKCKNK